jgi:hypothetical protein
MTVLLHRSYRVHGFAETGAKQFDLHKTPYTVYEIKAGEKPQILLYVFD